MRGRLYYSHPKFGQVRLPTNAATNADFLHYIGQQTCKNTYAQINGHLDPFVNSNNCNFTLIKQRYAGGVFCRNGCPMPVLLTRAPVYRLPDDSRGVCLQSPVEHQISKIKQVRLLMQGIKRECNHPKMHFSVPRACGGQNFL